MRAFLADGTVYVDSTDGEAFFLDREGRIGIETDDGAAIRWFIYRGGFVEAETTPLTKEQTALLDLVNASLAVPRT